MNSLLRRPVIALVAVLLVAGVIVIASWVGYYTPNKTDLEKQINLSERSIKKVDKKIAELKQSQQALDRHLSLQGIEKQLRTQNNATQTLLLQLNDNTNNGFSLASIAALTDKSVKITLKVNNRENFYSFVESIEALPTTDRIAINQVSATPSVFELTLHRYTSIGEQQ